MEQATAGKSRDVLAQERAARIEQAAKLYAEAQNAPVKRGAWDIYKEIAQKLGVSHFMAMDYVQTAFKRKTPYKIVHTYVRDNVTLNGELYLTPLNAAKMLRISSGAFHNWIKKEIGPTPSIMKVDGRDNLLFKEAALREWLAGVSPITTASGVVQYFNKKGELIRANGAAIPALGSVGSVGQAMLEALRPKVQSKSEAKRSAVQTGITFDESVVDKDGKVRTLAKAARYVGLPNTQFNAAVYGVLHGYGPVTKEPKIAHTYENARRGVMVVFDAAELRDWRKNVWKGLVKSDNHRRGGIKAWKTRKAKLAAAGKLTPVVPAAPVSQEPKQHRKIGRKRRTYISDFSKQDCMDEMRKLVSGMKRGAMNRKRWLRLSKTQRHFERYFDSFNNFMFASIKESVKQEPTKDFLRATKVVIDREVERRVNEELNRREITEATRKREEEEARERRMAEQRDARTDNVPAGFRGESVAQRNARSLIEAATRARIGKPWWKVW